MAAKKTVMVPMMTPTSTGVRARGGGAGCSPGRESPWKKDMAGLVDESLLLHSTEKSSQACGFGALQIIRESDDAQSRSKVDDVQERGYSKRREPECRDWGR